MLKNRIIFEEQKINLMEQT